MAIDLGKFRRYVASKFPDGESKGKDGNEFNIYCPKCGDEDRRAYVNLLSGKGQCYQCPWKSSGHFALISYLEKLPGTLAAAEWFNAHNDFSAHTIVTGVAKTDMTRRLPNEYQEITTEEGPYYEYIKSRGFGLQEIRDYRMGYCASGKYEGRVIMPVINYGKLEFFCDRSIDPNIPKNLKTLGIGDRSSSWPVKKSTVIFNIERCAGLRTIQIAEGIFTCLSLDGSIALLGKSCSTVQLRRLLKETVADTFILCLDAGTEDKTATLAKQLSDWGRTVYIREFDPAIGDGNDYLKKKIPLPGMKLYTTNLTYIGRKVAAWR